MSTFYHSFLCFDVFVFALLDQQCFLRDETGGGNPQQATAPMCCNLFGSMCSPSSPSGNGTCTSGQPAFRT